MALVTRVQIRAHGELAFESDRSKLGLAPMDMHPKKKRSPTAGLTLVEVTISMLCLAMVLGSLIPMMIQTRRLTEGSLARNTAANIAQSYMEQLKSMTL